MDPALQRRVQRYGWDKAASWYEHAWQQQLKPSHDALFEHADIQPGQRIIDIACGTGLVSFRAAAAAGTEGFVLGTDISDKMIELAIQASQEQGIENIQFERMDAEDLQRTDEEFDVALCALGLMYMPNPAAALREMYRVLKKGGTCAVSVWGAREKCGWADVFEIVDKRVSSEVCPMFFQLGNEKMLEKNMEIAGFGSLKIKRIQSALNFDSADAACAAAFQGGPVALAYHKFPENVQKEACAEYIASIETYRTATGYAVPGEFVIGTGYK